MLVARNGGWIMDEKDKKKLFMALVTEEGLEEVLVKMVHREEIVMTVEGGEPSLEHLLRLRLLEAIRGHILGDSMVHDKEWRKRVLEG